MRPELQLIKKLVIIAFALHVASLFAVVAIVALQISLVRLFVIFINGGPIFVFPPISVIVEMAAWFIAHAILTAVLLAALRSDYDQLRKLKTAAMLTMALTIAALPFLSYILSFWMAFSRQSFDILSAQTSLIFLINHGLILRGLGLTALLIAASMVIYHCHIMKLRMSLHPQLPQEFETTPNYPHP